MSCSTLPTYGLARSGGVSDLASHRIRQILVGETFPVPELRDRFPADLGESRVLDGGDQFQERGSPGLRLPFSRSINASILPVEGNELEQSFGLCVEGQRGDEFGDG